MAQNSSNSNDESTVVEKTEESEGDMTDAEEHYTTESSFSPPPSRSAEQEQEQEQELGVVRVHENTGLDNIDEESLTPQQREALKVAKKIIYVLTTYPAISPTMLQMGIGPATRPAVWKPVLEQLIKEGFVVREIRAMKTLAGGLRQAVVIRLTETRYISPHQYHPSEAGFDIDEDEEL